MIRGEHRREVPPLPVDARAIPVRVPAESFSKRPAPSGNPQGRQPRQNGFAQAIVQVPVASLPRQA